MLVMIGMVLLAVVTWWMGYTAWDNHNIPNCVVFVGVALVSSGLALVQITQMTKEAFACVGM